MGLRWHRFGFIISLDCRAHSHRWYMNGPLSFSNSLTHLYFSLNNKHPGTRHRTRTRILIILYPCLMTPHLTLLLSSNSGLEFCRLYSFVPYYFQHFCFIKAIGISKEYIVLHLVLNLAEKRPCCMYLSGTRVFGPFASWHQGLATLLAM